MLPPSKKLKPSKPALPKRGKASETGSSLTCYKLHGMPTEEKLAVIEGVLKRLQHDDEGHDENKATEPVAPAAARSENPISNFIFAKMSPAQRITLAKVVFDTGGEKDFKRRLLNATDAERDAIGVEIAERAEEVKCTQIIRFIDHILRGSGDGASKNECMSSNAFAGFQDAFTKSVRAHYDANVTRIDNDMRQVPKSVNTATAVDYACLDGSESPDCFFDLHADLEPSKSFCARALFLRELLSAELDKGTGSEHFMRDCQKVLEGKDDCCGESTRTNMGPALGSNSFCSALSSELDVAESKCIYASESMITSIKNDDVNALVKDVETALLKKRERAEDSSQRVAWRITPLEVVLWVQLCRCGCEGDCGASRKSHTIGEVAVWYNAERIFAKWIGRLFKKNHILPGSGAHHAYVRALNLWLECVATEWDPDVGRKTLYRHSWFKTFVSNESTRVTWGLYADRANAGVKFHNQYILREYSETFFIRSVITSICHMGHALACDRCDGDVATMDNLMRHVVCQLAADDSAWGAHLFSCGRTMERSSPHAWRVIMGSVGTELMDLLVHAFGATTAYEDPAMKPCTLPRWPLPYVSETTCEASAWGLYWLFSECSHPMTMYFDDGLSTYGPNLAQKWVSDGSWLVPCVTTCVGTFSSGCWDSSIEDAVEKARPRISLSSYSNKQEVPVNVRVFMSFVANMAVKSLKAQNAEGWNAMLNTGVTVNKVHSVPAAAMAPFVKVWSNSLEGQWNYTVVNWVDHMRSALASVKKPSNRWFICSCTLDTYERTSQERLRSCLEKDSVVTLRLAAELVQREAAEAEERRVAAQRRVEARAASKIERKAAQSSRKQKAAQKEAEREQQQQKAREDVETREWCEKMKSSIRAGILHGQANFDAYSELPDGPKREKQKRLFWKRWSTFKAARATDTRFSTLLEEFSSETTEFERLFERLSLLENPRRERHATDALPPAISTAHLREDSLSALDFGDAPARPPAPPVPVASTDALPPAISTAHLREDSLSALDFGDAPARPPAPVPITPSPTAQPSPAASSSPGGGFADKVLAHLDRASFPRGRRVGGRGGRGSRVAHGGRGAPAVVATPAAAEPVQVARSALDAQSVPDELTCSISFELLLHAVSIPCGHTFSRKGLDDHVKTAEFEGKQLTCPTCRAVFDKNATFRNWIVESMARRFAE